METAASVFDLSSVQAWFEEVNATGVLGPERIHAFENTLQNALEGGIEYASPPVLSILLLGASGAGKSQILNALAGEPLAKSNYIRPTTTHPLIYLHDSVPLPRLYEYGASLGELGLDSKNLRTHSREELRLRIIIDSPDIDTYRVEHRKLVLSLVPAVDLVIYVVTPQNYKDDSGWQEVLRNRGTRGFAFVMNKWDDEGKPAVQSEQDVDQDFLDMLREQAGYAKPIFFRISAESWIGETPEGRSLPNRAPGEQFVEFKDWIENGIPQSSVEKIQCRRRYAAYVQLSSEIARVTPDPRAYEEWVRQTDSKLDEFQSSAHNELALHAAEAAILAADRREMAHRPYTPGPFGISMRVLDRIIRFAEKIGTAGTLRYRRIRRNSEKVFTDALSISCGDQLRQIITAREYKARQQALAADSIAEAWSPLSIDFEKRINLQVNRRIMDLQARKFGTFRLVAGMGLMILAEIALVSIFSVSAWRLFRLFLLGTYPGASFFWTVAAMLACIIGVGYSALSLVFSTSVRRLRREILHTGADALQVEILNIRKVYSDYISNLERLSSTGKSFRMRCDEQAERLAAVLETVPHDHSDRLFAEVFSLADSPVESNEHI
jgi:hypothetical protein